MGSRDIEGLGFRLSGVRGILEHQMDKQIRMDKSDGNQAYGGLESREVYCFRSVEFRVWGLGVLRLGLRVSGLSLKPKP